MHLSKSKKGSGLQLLLSTFCLYVCFIGSVDATCHALGSGDFGSSDESATDTFANTFYGQGELISRAPNTLVAERSASIDVGCTGAIIPWTGNKIETERDFSAAEEAGLALTRTYNHYWQGAGLFGKYWISSFDYALTFGSTAVDSCFPRPGGGACSIGNNTVIYAWRPDGRTIRFIKKSDGVFYEDKPSPVAKIENSGSNLVLYTEDNSREVYGITGRIHRVTNAHGVGWTYSYNGTYPARVTHTSGRHVQFTWSEGQLVAVHDPAGQQYSFTYHANKFGDGLHRLASASKPGTPSLLVSYHYELSSQPSALTGKSIGGGRYSRFTYGERGYVTGIEHNGQRKYEFSYTEHADGRLTTIETNPLGKKTIYESRHGKLLSVVRRVSTHSPSMAALIEYDANGYPAMRSNFRGDEEALFHNAKGQLIKKIEAYGSTYGRQTTYVWDAAKNRIINVTVGADKGGDALLRTSFTYTAENRVETVTRTNLSGVGSTEPQVTTFSYTSYPDGMLHTKSVDGPLPGTGDRITYTYGTTRFLYSVIDGLGHKTTLGGYNGRGQPGWIVDANGAKTSFYYDARGRLARVRTYRNGATQDFDYTYSSRGRLSKVAAPDGMVTEYIYGTNTFAWSSADWDRLAAVRWGPDSPVAMDLAPGVPGYFEYRWRHDEIRYTYDLAGNLITSDVSRVGEVRRPRGCAPMQPCLPGDFEGYRSISRTAFADYDELSRRRTVRGNDGQSVHYTYTNNGDVNSITDSLGNKTTFYLDQLDRIHVIVDPAGGRTTYSYDALNRITAVADPRGAITRYTYDGFGNLWKLSSPDTGTTTFIYDRYGRLVSSTRNDGTLTTYHYDIAGRLVSRAAGGQEHRFSYDTCANGKGRLCQVWDPHGQLDYSYTKEGLLARKEQRIGGSSISFDQSYGYDHLGRIIDVTYPGGVSVGYDYEYGRIGAMMVQIGGVTHDLLADISYEPLGPAAGWTYGNGLARRLVYDLDGRLSELYTRDGIADDIFQGPEPETIQSLAYQYNQNNLITKITNGLHGGTTQTYSYDPLSRIDTSTMGYGYDWDYDYDANGNRTRAAVSGVSNRVDSYAVASGSNQLLAVNGGLNIDYSYDPDGNLVSGDGNTYTYGPHNRLSTSTRGGVRTNYWVNALGQRTYKTQGSPKASFYVYGVDGSLAAEHNGFSGAWTWTQYLRLEGELIGLVRNNKLYYVHNDHLGRPELITDAVKAIKWRADNFTFSRNVRIDDIGGLNLGFPGQYFDAESGLWHNGFRDFDQKTGRYIQSDPIGLVGGLNTYTYVGGNPVSFVDPFGLQRQPDSGEWLWRPPTHNCSFMIDCMDAMSMAQSECSNALPFTRGLGSMFCRMLVTNKCETLTANYCSGEELPPKNASWAAPLPRPSDPPPVPIVTVHDLEVVRPDRIPQERSGGGGYSGLGGGGGGGGFGSGTVTVGEPERLEDK